LALENVLKKMCEEQDWEDEIGEKPTVGDCFQKLSDEGLFDANKAMVGEWQKIINGVRVGVQKTGDRKNWHGDDIDEDYCLLLIHQIASFLVFSIRQYEKNFP
jgi:hypothetical protein